MALLTMVCESYFSLMKGWHGEEMGYQPASSGLFTSVWISKMLRGARRNFPSKFAEREAHSVAFFKKFRRPYAYWYFIKEFFVPHGGCCTTTTAPLLTRRTATAPHGAFAARGDQGYQSRLRCGCHPHPSATRSQEARKKIRSPHRRALLRLESLCAIRAEAPVFRGIISKFEPSRETIDRDN